MAPAAPLLRPPLLLLLLGGVAALWPAPARALPIVDPGLFVIMGVKTCRAGSGYCLLGNDCTLDEDFLPDDRGGHCDGLRSAFTPSAHFVCCRYSAENSTNATSTDASTASTASTPFTNSTAPTDSTAASTVTAAAAAASSATSPTTTDADDASAGSTEETTTTDDDRQMTTEVAGHTDLEETTLYVGDAETTTTRDAVEQEDMDEEGNETRSVQEEASTMSVVKKKRIETEEQRSANEELSTTYSDDSTASGIDYTITTTDYPSTVEDRSDSTLQMSESATEETGDVENHETDAQEGHDFEENENSMDPVVNNGVMLHDILKLITEGEWQVSIRNNEVTDDASPDDITTEDGFTDTATAVTSPIEEYLTERTTTPEDTMDLSHRESPETENDSAATIRFTTTKRTTESGSAAVDDEDPPVKSTTQLHKTGENTPFLKIVTSLETKVTVKDRVEQGDSSTDAAATTPISASERPGTTEAGPATTEGKETAPSNSYRNRRLCLGDPIHEDACWLVRFVDTRFDSFLCRGTMLGRGVVLTSAECAVSLHQAGANNVRAAGRSAVPSMDVASIAVHEDFGPREAGAARQDVGLVRVTGRDACEICLAPVRAGARGCYTFAGPSQGDGEVTKQQCQQVNIIEHKEYSSLRCILRTNETLKVHTGAPLVCGEAVVGVAYDSSEAPSFTASTQILPWVWWNVQRFYSV